MRKTTLFFAMAVLSAADSLTTAERELVIQGVIANLKQHYVVPETAKKAADALLAHDYSAVASPAALADLLTRQLREASRDMHLEVIYSENALPSRPPGPPSPESRARYQKALEDENCTFEKVEILPHNIGYLKLNTFPDTAFCEATAGKAMASLNQTDAIIFDLRDNRGGYPNMVMMIAAYLFDHPEYMYNPRENTTEQFWTRSPVAGNNLADKRAFILTSGKTMSAAEHFTYDLKMLKRATIVGETTRGAAHSGAFYRIDDHFGIALTEVAPINPFSKSDWEGVGVEPDVKVKAADSLGTAERLALLKLRTK